MTGVTRAGDVVHRTRNPASARVEELLARLERAGFPYSPRFLGIGQDGRQRLRYAPGEAGTYPLSAAVRGTGALRSAARVLRRLHDTTQGWASSMTGGWLLPDVAPAEVVCHGDFAPYNLVFDGTRVAAVIDFDTAHPGPRLRDIAYAAYRFAPLADPRNEVSFGSVEQQAARARVFCDAYGLDDRTTLVATLRARLADLVAYIRTQAAAGHPAFREHVAAGHDVAYLRDIDYLTRQEKRLTALLG
jgi:hypothetical protein